MERYSLSGTIQTGPYLMVDLDIDFYDIALRDGQIWYAAEDASEPVQVFLSNGTKVFSISSSVIPRAHGMTFDDDGYLWVSDAEADLIYQIDLDPVGISGQSCSPMPEPMILPSLNPFSSSVSFELTGFNGVRCFRVLDMSGRMVTELQAGEQLLWDGTDNYGRNAPPGVYIIVAEDDTGARASTRLVRL